jgi:hypothetical protein
VTLAELREVYGPRDLLTLLEIIYRENGNDPSEAEDGGAETWRQTSGPSPDS